MPRAVLVKPRSSRMRASTGKAVMLIEMPMKSANGRKVVPGAARLGKSQSALRTPSRYGKRMPTWLTNTAVRACCFSWVTSSSMPMTNMNRQTPIWLSIRRVPREAGGKTIWKKPGQSQPSKRGAEQDAGDHFSDDGRLPRFVHQAAANAGGQDDEDELDEQPGERVLEVLAQVGQERRGRTYARTGLQGGGRGGVLRVACCVGRRAWSRVQPQEHAQAKNDQDQRVE